MTGDQLAVRLVCKAGCCSCKRIKPGPLFGGGSGKGSGAERSGNSEWMAWCPGASSLKLPETMLNPYDNAGIELQVTQRKR